eukprot:2647242-Ditylum_brightwellii.AAC.1
MEYNISTVPSKNLAIVVNYFKYACKRLEHNKALTLKLKNVLFKVFQTTPGDNFNSLILAWHQNLILGTQPHPHYRAFLAK